MEDITVKGGTVTVKLSGELDHHAAQYWRERIDTQVQEVACRLLRLDFGGVTFMDSSGVGLIMGRYRLMQRLGGRTEVMAVSPKWRVMLYLAGIDRLGIMKGEDDDETCE